MGFSRQEYWSGLPFPSPRDLPNLGVEPRSPALQADSLPSEAPGKSLDSSISNYKREFYCVISKTSSDATESACSHLERIPERLALQEGSISRL